MSKFKDYYKLLGLNPSARLLDIKKAFAMHAKQSHPDTAPPHASASIADIPQYSDGGVASGSCRSTERFVMLHEAYRTLTRDRQAYDASYRKHRQERDTHVYERPTAGHDSATAHEERGYEFYSSLFNQFNPYSSHSSSPFSSPSFDDLFKSARTNAKQSSWRSQHHTTTNFFNQEGHYPHFVHHRRPPCSSSNFSSPTSSPRSSARYSYSDYFSSGRHHRPCHHRQETTNHNQPNKQFHRKQRSADDEWLFDTQEASNNTKSYRQWNMKNRQRNVRGVGMSDDERRVSSGEQEEARRTGGKKHKRGNEGLDWLEDEMWEEGHHKRNGRKPRLYEEVVYEVVQEKRYRKKDMNNKHMVWKLKSRKKGCRERACCDDVNSKQKEDGGRWDSKKEKLGGYQRTKINSHDCDAEYLLFYVGKKKGREGVGMRRQQNYEWFRENTQRKWSDGKHKKHHKQCTGKQYPMHIVLSRKTSIHTGNRNRQTNTTEQNYSKHHRHSDGISYKEYCSYDKIFSSSQRRGNRQEREPDEGSSPGRQCARMDMRRQEGSELVDTPPMTPPDDTEGTTYEQGMKQTLLEAQKGKNNLDDEIEDIPSRCSSVHDSADKDNLLYIESIGTQPTLQDLYNANLHIASSSTVAAKCRTCHPDMFTESRGLSADTGRSSPTTKTDGEPSAKPTHSSTLSQKRGSDGGSSETHGDVNVHPEKSSDSRHHNVYDSSWIHPKAHRNTTINHNKPSSTPCHKGSRDDVKSRVFRIASRRMGRNKQLWESIRLFNSALNTSSAIGGKTSAGSRGGDGSGITGKGCTRHTGDDVEMGLPVLDANFTNNSNRVEDIRCLKLKDASRWSC
eukprot:GHVQ01004625.1.p1 GENE.GHVQ01004625.1~~GHVQ01004625.1.p1  ORF type:complete len:844 (-),score=136.58 GHVQ01004625.1:1297-3828(-)